MSGSNNDVLRPYDGLLLISFGGPESPEEVMPFLLRVTAGRGIPQERLDAVAERYLAHGGVSPINAETRALADALRAELAERGIELPLEIGNRNSPPFLSAALRGLAEAGATRVLSMTTSAYQSYASCRQYLENVADALTEVPGDLQVDRIRHYAHHPGFVYANVAAIGEAIDRLPAGVSRTGAHIVFVTHSLPVEMAESSGPPPHASPGSYVDWHRTVAANIAAQLGQERGREPAWDLAYCSRSGSPHQPWLQPDVKDLLARLADSGVRQVVLAPIGFTSDHMEVVFDLDEDAVPAGEALGLQVVRASTARTHPAFIRGLADLFAERAAQARGEMVLPEVINNGSPGRYACPPECCPHLTRRGAPTA
ncbi:ferrochelatase [Ammonicoccus fulvus]|uniref:Coproporphyrin III ferrochelatase n=1 Tax=Ammonicoccus fulvus TaxID=3138240 RepID=A0ABZ3FTJ3_9ACTN